MTSPILPVRIIGKAIGFLDSNRSLSGVGGVLEGPHMPSLVAVARIFSAVSPRICNENGADMLLDRLALSILQRSRFFSLSQKLNIACYDVDDEFLTELVENIVCLKELELWASVVTDAGIRRLLSNPRLKMTLKNFFVVDFPQLHVDLLRAESGMSEHVKMMLMPNLGHDVQACVDLADAGIGAVLLGLLDGPVEDARTWHNTLFLLSELVEYLPLQNPHLRSIVSECLRRLEWLFDVDNWWVRYGAAMLLSEMLRRRAKMTIDSGVSHVAVSCLKQTVDAMWAQPVRFLADTDLMETQTQLLVALTLAGEIASGVTEDDEATVQQAKGILTSAPTQQQSRIPLLPLVGHIIDFWFFRDEQLRDKMLLAPATSQLPRGLEITWELLVLLVHLEGEQRTQLSLDLEHKGLVLARRHVELRRECFKQPPQPEVLLSLSSPRLLATERLAVHGTQSIDQKLELLQLFNSVAARPKEDELDIAVIMLELVKYRMQTARRDVFALEFCAENVLRMLSRVALVVAEHTPAPAAETAAPEAGAGSRRLQSGEEEEESDQQPLQRLSALVETTKPLLRHVLFGTAPTLVEVIGKKQIRGANAPLRAAVQELERVAEVLRTSLPPALQQESGRRRQRDGDSEDRGGLPPPSPPPNPLALQICRISKVLGVAAALAASALLL